MPDVQSGIYNEFDLYVQVGNNLNYCYKEGTRNVRLVKESEHVIQTNM